MTCHNYMLKIQLQHSRWDIKDKKIQPKATKACTVICLHEYKQKL